MSEGRIVTRVSASVLNTSERELPRSPEVSSPVRSSASSVSPQRAPRGSASFREPDSRGRVASTTRGVIRAPSSDASLLGCACGVRSHQALLLGLGLEQTVVASPAADDVAQSGVVDLEDRARVVAEVAKQAEVEPDPLGYAPGGQ